MAETTYADCSRSTEDRLEDLLARMTPEEKVGQLFQGNARSDDVELWVRDWGCGSLLQASGEKMIRLQKIASEETRLGIPLLFGIDAIHGHNQWRGATIFPTQMTLACSWKPELAERMGAITGREMRYSGLHWTFSPTAELARDLRWGRCDEAAGEDPLLASDFVAAIVRGYQGKSLSDPDSVLACVKHFAGYCGTEGGRDASEAHLTRRELLTTFLPVFEAAVRAGAATVMIAYNCIDGQPCNTNRWLLSDVLVDAWEFRGFTITDWNNVGALVTRQFTCRDIVEASVKSLEAGMHMCMTTPEFVRATIEAVRTGRLDSAIVDAAVRRILRMKFAVGVFDDKRYPDLDAGKAVWACPAHQEASLAAARESLVLLKNEGDLLPLTQEVRTVAVIGANADDEFAQLGDWSRVGWNTHERCEGETGSGHPRENITTIVDALRARGGLNVTFARGCGPLDAAEDDSGFEAATRAAAQADVAVVVLGDERSIVGETFDRAHLALPGNQQAMLKAVHATGTPVVLVLINSKPIAIPWAAEHVPAIVEAFNPGMRGGTAVIDALFGARNFHGKLCVSFPRCTGQLPVYYNQLPGWHCEQPTNLGYVDETPGPLYAFGYGLSYTRFDITDVKLSPEVLRTGETLTVSATVKNVGDRPGVEVVQVYVNDVASTLSTPCKELKGYARVTLEPAEEQTVTVEIPCAKLAFFGADLNPVVEPGAFELMVGSSSRDRDLQRFRFEVID